MGTTRRPRRPSSPRCSTSLPNLPPAGTIHGLLQTLQHNPAPWAPDRTEGGCTGVHSERLGPDCSEVSDHRPRAANPRPTAIAASPD